jgi:hypothetical protein
MRKKLELIFSGSLCFWKIPNGRAACRAVVHLKAYPMIKKKTNPMVFQFLGARDPANKSLFLLVGGKQ